MRTRLTQIAAAAMVSALSVSPALAQDTTPPLTPDEKAFAQQMDAACPTVYENVPVEKEIDCALKIRAYLSKSAQQFFAVTNDTALLLKTPDLASARGGVNYFCPLSANNDSATGMDGLNPSSVKDLLDITAAADECASQMLVGMDTGADLKINPFEMYTAKVEATCLNMYAGNSANGIALCNKWKAQRTATLVPSI